MDSIQTTLQNKFAAPLPDFYKRRIVFWHDSEGEFADRQYMRNTIQYYTKNKEYIKKTTYDYDYKKVSNTPIG